MSVFAIANILQNARDGVSKSISMIDFSHSKINDGESFYVEGSVELTDTEELTVKFTTPNSTKRCHFGWEVAANGISDFLLYEKPTGGMTGGTPMTPLNARRESTIASSMAVVTGVTTAATTPGTKIHDWSVGALQFKGYSGGQSIRESKIILTPNTIYLGIVKSYSTGNIVSFNASWYEQNPQVGLKVAD